MHAPLFVIPQPVTTNIPDTSIGEVADLLRQLLDVQREQVILLKNQAANQDAQAKWRAFLAKWVSEFPDVGVACKEVLPSLERAYLTMIRDVTDRLKADDPDALEDEFVLNEFLDRYGVRLGQLGTIMSQVGPLAEAAPAPAADGSGQ